VEVFRRRRLAASGKVNSESVGGMTAGLSFSKAGFHGRKWNSPATLVFLCRKFARPEQGINRLHGYAEFPGGFSWE
jgi:hypothetical protein